MAQVRILFVDDEPNIRHTLPAVLQQHGFDIRVASSVPEALVEISSQQFDVLISDLNIGHPADGYVVVNSMRRTQPNCINFILTGYPSFETALQALRAQVDDYLVKPTEIETLVTTIEQKLNNRQPHRPLSLKPVTRVIRENIREITGRSLSAMKTHPELGVLPLSDKERINNLPAMLAELSEHVESPATGEIRQYDLTSAAEHGRLRRKQGYSVTMLVDDTGIVDQSIFDVIQDNLLALDMSRVISDLKRLSYHLEAQLKETLSTFLATAVLQTNQSVRMRLK